MNWSVKKKKEKEQEKNFSVKVEEQKWVIA